MRLINRVLSIIILSSIMNMTGSFSLWAEDQSEPFNQPMTSRYDTMNSVKDEISGLLIENKKLEERYSQLKAQWRIMQIQQQDVSDSPAENNADISQPQKRLMNVVQEEMDQYQNEQLPDDNAGSYLNDESSEDGEQLSLLELHLEDLQYQHRELELELKLLKVQNQDKQHEFLGQMEANKTALQGVLQRERQLQELVTRKEEALKVAPQQIPLLEKENQQLEEDVLTLEKKKEFKEKEVAILNDKHTLKEKSSEEVLSKIEKEKQELTARVENLKNEHNQLSDKVEISLDRQQRKNELIQGIIKFDQENQQLQAKITEMSEKIKSHQ